MSATPEREQAEAARDREQFVAALDSLETIMFGDCWRRSRDEMEEKAQALAAAVERAEKAEAKAEGVQWGDLSASITERERADAAVERERELTRALVAEAGELAAQRDYYRRRWLIYGVHHRQRMTREEYVSVVMGHLSDARSCDALTAAATALQRSHQEVPPVVPAAPEVLPEETP